MRKLYFFLSPFLCLFFVTNFSQNTNSNSVFCYADECLNDRLAHDSVLHSQFHQYQLELSSYIDNNTMSGLGSRTNNPAIKYYVPVVVHIIHNPIHSQGVGSNITDNQVLNAIEVLNLEFNDDYLLSSSGEKMDIEFCLATKDIVTGQTFLGSNPGIFRIASAYTNHNVVTQEDTLKALSYYPSNNYLNIWVVENIFDPSTTGQILGYSSFPNGGPANLDGIVMRYDRFGNIANTVSGSPICTGCNLHPTSMGRVMVHEAAHYFGIFHTFQGGCAGMNSIPNDPDNCAQAGDYICDTPPVATNNSGCSPINSCNETYFTPSPDRPDMIENHMDYTSEACHTTFTAGQKSRMHAVIVNNRSSLVSSSNLIATGVQCVGINADFAVDQLAPCTDSTINFSALYTGNVSNNTTYTWNFGDGSPLISNVLISTQSHAYSLPGSYTVTLTVEETVNGNTQTVDEIKLDYIYVSICNPINTEQSHWFFGRYAGLDFSSGAPVVDPSAYLNRTLFSFEAAASQSDNSGNLLFYTNSQTIWDANHSVVDTTLFGNHSATQGALIIPDPGNGNEYYVFTAAEGVSGNGGRGFHYTKVSVVGPNVTTGPVNVPVFPPANFRFWGVDSAVIIQERIIGVHRCDNGYWIITSGFNQSNNDTPEFLVYELTSSGLSYSASYPNAPNDLGQFKVSPDGGKLATCSNQANSSTTNGPADQGLTVFDFDPTIGSITNGMQLLNDTILTYGCSFSPNSQLLYCGASHMGNMLDKNVFQFDLNASNPFLSKRQISNIVDKYIAFQLGPDGKIYIAKVDQRELSVIHNPNQVATATNTNACVFEYSGVQLNNNQTGFSINASYSLPNMIDAKPVAGLPPTDFNYLQTNCFEFQFEAPPCQTSYSWDFGDGNVSFVQNPIHTYSSSGGYTVRLTTGGQTLIQRVSTRIVNPGITGPTCYTQPSSGLVNYSINSDTGVIYNWLVQTSANNITYNNVSNVDVDWGGQSGIVQVTAVDANTGCQSTSALAVNSVCTPCNINAGDDVTICSGDCISLAAANGLSYLWQPTEETTTAITVCPSVTTDYIVIGTCASGLPNVDTVRVHVNTLTANFSPDSACIGDVQFTDQSFGSNGISSWNWYFPGNVTSIAQNPIENFSNNGVWNIGLIVNDNDGCIDTLIKPIVISPKPVVSFSGLGQKYCLADSPSTLMGNPLGGTYSGPGISGNTFDPSQAGSGTHTIIYDYTDGITNCTNSDSMSVVVSPNPVTPAINGLAPNYCLMDIPVNLTANPSGGIFSGMGIMGNSFDPGSAGAGNHTIVYTLSDPISGCISSNSVTTAVNVNPSVSFSGLSSSYCSSAPATALIGVPSGGTFIGSGVTMGTFDPSLPIAGIHTIIYTYTDISTGCANSDTNSTEVYTTPTVNLSGLQAAYCSSDSAVMLNGTPIGGTFSGPGVIGNLFDPQSVSIGITLPIVYNFTDPSNGCSNTDTILTIVNTVPTVSYAGLNSSYCEDHPANTLTGNPPGGVFSGPGIIGGPAPFPYTFNPQSAGVGNSYSITYTYTNSNGCSDSALQQTEVFALPVANFSPLSGCEGIPVQFLDLSGNTACPISSWYWDFNDGSGAISTIQNPVHTYTTAGTYQVFLIVTDCNGCMNTITHTVIINAAPAATIISSILPPICLGDSITLTASGGTSYLWSTGAVDDSITISPQVFQSYNVIATDATGCQDTANIDIDVYAPFTFSAGTDQDICLGDSAVLNASNAVSWFWSTSEISQSILVSPMSTETYSVTAIDTNGCSITDQVVVTVNGVPMVDIGPDRTLCLHSCARFVPLSASDGPCVTYEWYRHSFQGGTAVKVVESTSREFCFRAKAISSSLYYLTVTDTCGHDCSATDTVLVTTIPWDNKKCKELLLQDRCCKGGTNADVLTPKILTNSNDSESEPIIYPNPAADYVMINVPSSYLEGSLAIYDALGRNVIQQRISQQFLQIETDQLKVGMYQIQITNFGKVYTNKLIIE